MLHAHHPRLLHSRLLHSHPHPLLLSHHSWLVLSHTHDRLLHAHDWLLLLHAHHTWLLLAHHHTWLLLLTHHHAVDLLAHLLSHHARHTLTTHAGLLHRLLLLHLLLGSKSLTITRASRSSNDVILSSLDAIRLDHVVHVCIELLYLIHVEFAIITKANQHVPDGLL